MNEIKNQSEWDFIINETHNGNKDIRIKREMLFTMQQELSKNSPNMDFYNELKNKYLV